MLQFILRRVFYLIPTLIAISVVMFIIIQLPPGDYLTTLTAAMASQGENVDQAALVALKERYGLGQPVYVQIGNGSLILSCKVTLGARLPIICPSPHSFGNGWGLPSSCRSAPYSLCGSSPFRWASIRP